VKRIQQELPNDNMLRTALLGTADAEQSVERDGPMSRVFISHSSIDKECVREIANKLEGHGVSVWLGEWEIAVGDSISQRVQDGLADCDFVVVVISNAGSGSGWVSKEWQSRIGNEASLKHVQILPVLLEECDIPQLLADKAYADFTKDFESGFAALIDGIDRQSERAKPKNGLRVSFPKARLAQPRRSFHPAILLLVIGAIGFVCVDLAVWITQPTYPTLVYERFSAIVGLPMAAIASLIVVVFLHQSQGNLEVEIGKLRLTGASGQVCLRLVCFILITIAIKLLW
jgi:hypothetical protein